MKIYKYYYMKILKKILSLKFENLILLLFIPVIISQLTKSNFILKFPALIIVFGLFYTTKYMVKETRKEYLTYINSELKKIKIHEKRNYLNKMIYIDQEQNSFLYF